MKNLVASGIGLLVLVTACQSGEAPALKTGAVQGNEAASCIQPLQGLEIAPEQYRINTDQQTVIKIRNGGQVTFPAHAFVDQHGKPVHGEVTVNWQEFHSLTDIMLSGIPMKYDSAGVQHDFVSGGMFSISAEQGNKELELAPDKPATVELASLDDTPCYSFYKLDDKSGDWDYKKTVVAEPIAPPVDAAKQADQKSSVKKNMAQLIDVEVDTKAFPELQELNIIAWETTEKLKLRKNQDIRRAKCALEAAETPGNYILTVEADKVVKRYPVKPYTLEQAKRDAHEVEAEIEKEVAYELQFQADQQSGKFKRVTEIETLGTYNWDRMYHLENKQVMIADFEYEGHFKREALALFFVCPEMNVVIRVDTHHLQSSITFSKKVPFMLVGIAPDNSVYALNGEDKKAISNLRDGDRIELHLDRLNRKIESGADLQNVLNQQAG